MWIRDRDRFSCPQPTAWCALRCHRTFFAVEAWPFKPCLCSCGEAGTVSKVRAGLRGDVGRNDLPLFCQFSTLPSPEVAAGPAGAAQSNRKLKKALLEDNGAAGGRVPARRWDCCASPLLLPAEAEPAGTAEPNTPPSSPSWWGALGRRADATSPPRPIPPQLLRRRLGMEKIIVLRSAPGDRRRARSPSPPRRASAREILPQVMLCQGTAGHHHPFMPMHPSSACAQRAPATQILAGSFQPLPSTLGH